MIRSAVLRIFAIVILLAPAGALPAASAGGADGLEAAERAYAGGLPTVAAAILGGIDPGSLDGESARARAILLARSLIDTGSPEAVPAILAGFAGDPAAEFWAAQARLAAGDVKPALEKFRSLAGDPAFGGPARNGLARALAASGDLGSAIAALEEIPAESRTPRDDLDRADYLARDGQSAEALRLIGAIRATGGADEAELGLLTAQAAFLAGDHEAARRALAGRPPGPPDLQARAAMLDAEISAARGDRENAERTLEKFLDRSAWPPLARELFAALDRLYASQESPSPADLARWAEASQGSPRARLAKFYLGRTEAGLSRWGRAAEAYRAFLAEAPDDPLAPAARKELSEMAASLGRTGDALAPLAGDSGPEAEFLRGLALARAGDYRAAGHSFELAAGGSGWASARFNAQLAGILAGDGGETARFDDPPLEIAMALAMARRRDPAAPEVLERLANSAPAPWNALAGLAAAEARYIALDFEGARRDLLRISNAPPQVAEDARALEVFAADDGSPDSAPAVEKSAREFLEKYPESPRRAEVLMKLGEVLFRKGDYVSARARFSEASTAAPGGELDERAQFLAAQAASRTMDPQSMEESLEIYEDIVRRGGPLALRSRLAQALLLNATGRSREAIAVLDNLLASNPDDELRNAAVIEKGDTLFALGATDPASFRLAAEAWRSAAGPSSPVRWRNQALTKIGAALEKAGETDAALASYYAALEVPAGGEPEFFWFYKAGFDAARMLESKGRIQEAAALYEKLAVTEGPRSEEARQKLNRLRLENFLWDENDPPGS